MSQPKREIWFAKVAWSYMPCHWKGLATMVLGIGLTIAAFFLSQDVAGTLGYKDTDWLVFPILLVGWLSMMVVAKRHS